MGLIGEVAKKHGVSEQRIYTWRKRFGAMDANEGKRLRELEQENARLKKLVAQRDQQDPDGRPDGINDTLLDRSPHYLSFFFSAGSPW